MDDRPVKRAKFWTKVILWTTILLAFSCTVALFRMEPALGAQNLASADWDAAARAFAVFAVPPIVTVWAVGIIAITYRSRLLCAVPSIMLISSTFVSALFPFPAATAVTICGLFVTVLTVLQNLIKART